MVFRVAVCPEDVGGETHEASSGVYLPIRCNEATIKQRSTGGGAEGGVRRRDRVMDGGLP